MSTEKRSAEEQVADEANRKALNPNAAKQKISDGQANPEFQENRERLKAERLARETGRTPPKVRNSSSERTPAATTRSRFRETSRSGKKREDGNSIRLPVGY